MSGIASDHADVSEATLSALTPQNRALTAAVLSGAALERDIRRALDGLNVQLEFTPQSGLLIARIESACPQIIILDLDITPQPADGRQRGDQAA
jgi:hypothetical protein